MKSNIYCVASGREGNRESNIKKENKDEALNKDAFRATNVSSPCNVAHAPSPCSVTHTPSPRRVVMRGIKSFLFRPISRIKTLRDDEAGVRAFTLVELLVVVLIIGVLSAIAIPMYQGAVDKSHWSTMLPASKAIKDAEEAFKMTNGEYSDTMKHLDVQMNNSDLTFDLQTPNNLSQPNVIKVTNSKLGDRVRLASYLDDSPMFAGQLHCEANDGPNGRGTRLCSKLLQGQELTSADGYTGYLLDQAIDKATCDNAGRFFGQKTNTCYKTNGERCTALGMPYNESTQFCGYTRGNNLEVNEGGICTHYQCSNSTFNNGAICDGSVDAGSMCINSTFTNGSICVSDSYACTGGNTTFDNSLCISRGGYGGCRGATFSNDSVCYAGEGMNDSRGCAAVTYNDTSCCCGGAACPNKYRCSDTRCAAVEQQVQEIMIQVNALH